MAVTYIVNKREKNISFSTTLTQRFIHSKHNNNNDIPTEDRSNNTTTSALEIFWI